MKRPWSLAALILLTALAAGAAFAQPKFEDHYASNGTVKIHYVAAGSSSAPLVATRQDNWAI